VNAEQRRKMAFHILTHKHVLVSVGCPLLLDGVDYFYYCRKSMGERQNSKIIGKQL
jgi:hypothetical protein